MSGTELSERWGGSKQTNRKEPSENQLRGDMVGQAVTGLWGSGTPFCSRPPHPPCSSAWRRQALQGTSGPVSGRP